jgi:hypothetical protein
VDAGQVIGSLPVDVLLGLLGLDGRAAHVDQTSAVDRGGERGRCVSAGEPARATVAVVATSVDRRYPGRTLPSYAGEATMILYILLGLVALGVVVAVVRSPTFRALMRGRGVDPGQWGSQLDHLYDRGFGASWNDDGRGTRNSHINSPHTRRHD